MRGTGKHWTDTAMEQLAAADAAARTLVFRGVSYSPAEALAMAARLEGYSAEDLKAEARCYEKGHAKSAVAYGRMAAENANAAAELRTLAGGK